MNLTNRFKSIHSYRLIIIIAVMICLVVGIVPSFLLSDWAWFSRSGSLLVIFGICIVWLDYQGQINNDLDVVLTGFSDYLESNAKNESNKSQIESDVSKQFDKVRAATKNRFNNIEFCLVAIGTFIWGYGDLFNKLYECT